jgi:hypothetical protein
MTAVGDAAAHWPALDERRAFKIENPEAIFEKACAEFAKEPESFDVKLLSKNRYYLHSLESKEYGDKIILVMVEDHGASERWYNAVAFTLPEMSSYIVSPYVPGKEGGDSYLPLITYLDSTLIEVVEWNHDLVDYD